MRAPLLLPISIALLSAFPALAQDAPRVLFCSGPCFAVDANGVRTPAPKGTELRPNQRFETGPGGYAQLKLGADAAMAVGDGARVRFQPAPMQEPMIVNLDVGRARMLLRDGIGKPTRPIELNTADGRFLLRNADVEVKRTQLANTGNVTVMKVNAGQAQMRTGSTWTPVATSTVQGVSAGKIISQPIASTEMAPAAPVTRLTAAPTPAPVPHVQIGLPTIRPLPPTVTAALPGSIAAASPRPVLPRGELIPIQPIITPTGELKTLTNYVLTDPVLTTSTSTRSLELIDTSTTSLSSISLTTTSTSLTDTTVTKLTTSPTTLTTTSTTTSTLTTSPLTTTTIQPITISPTLITR
jgi:hypothetical protein